MEFIPFNEEELLEVPCKVKHGDIEMETVLIVVPLCGSNEVDVMKLLNAKDERPQREVFADVFDRICKGYVSGGKQIMFTKEVVGSKVFNYLFTKWLVENLYCFNVLCLDQKKN
jgi:hypothetical protein